MAVQIVITDNSVSPLDGSKNVTAVFWLNAPANRQIAKPNFISAVPVALQPAGTLAQLQSGALVEQVQSFTRPSSTTPAQIEVELQNTLTTLQAAVTASGGGKFIGATFDSATQTWTVPP